MYERRIILFKLQELIYFLQLLCLPSEDEDNEAPSDFSFFKLTEESRCETDEVINSPPEPSNVFSSVARIISLSIRTAYENI